jgi:HAD superfamily hydrolase (TIGR01509 family)
LRDRGILFDYNGVLAGDEALQERAMAEAVLAYGISLSHALYKECCFGQTDHEGFERLRLKFPKELVRVDTGALLASKLAAYQRQAREASILFPEAKEILTRLHGHYRLALVTSSSRAEVLPVLQQEHVEDLFDAIVTVEDVTCGKPDPEGYRTALRLLNLTPDKAVVIEDSPTGIRAAKAAGIRCIAVLQTTKREELSEADSTIDSIADIQNKAIPL